MKAVDFQRVFNALASPHMLLDRELRYVAANRAYLETTERKLEDLAGQYVMDMFPNPDESGRRLEASFRKVLATGETDTIPYLAYPITLADGRVENLYWTVVHTPIFDDAGTVAFVMQNTVDVTEFVHLREAAGLPFSSLSAETSLIERTREAEAKSAEFRQMFQQAPAFFAVLSGPDHIFTFASDSYVRLIGNRSLLGLPLREALPEVVEQGFVSLLDRVYREGVAHSAEGARVMLANAGGGAVQETFLDFSYNPIRGPDGKVTGVFVQGTDRTESFRALERQRLLIDELNHRVKNALATVQSIAALTLRSGTDVARMREDFEGRIVALAKAHNLLSQRRWEATDLTAIVREELTAYDTANVQISGPPRMVDAKTTLALALLIHELATNAAKYGALSRPEGRLSVNWQALEGSGLQIDWVERGGPPVAPPVRRGFGTRMLNTVVTGELGGALETRFAPEGFSASLRLPAVGRQTLEYGNVA